MLMAIRQILVPQATVLLLSQVELARMAETWREGGGDMTAEDVAELTGMGCEYVLVKCTGSTGSSGHGSGKHISNTLYDGDGIVAGFDWQHLPGPFVGAGGTLSAALAAMMARGVPVQDAVQAAQEFTVGALAHAQRFGMGKLVPNMFFGWSAKSAVTGN
jgi:hydroxymethylpyrimidine/phosphomethylpyrimidine kinase